MKDGNELRECVVCHLDSLVESMVDGVCEECLERFETEDKYCTEFQKAHGYDYDGSYDG